MASWNTRRYPSATVNFSFSNSIVLLVGSIGSGIPAVAVLTKICQEEASTLGEKYAKAWESIKTHCEEIGQDPNVENVLSRLRIMLNAVGKKDFISGLNKKEIETLGERAVLCGSHGCCESLQQWPGKKSLHWVMKLTIDFT